MKRFIVCWWSLLQLISVSSQELLKIGEWNDHVSFNRCKWVESTPSSVYGVCEMGIFRIDLETSSFQRYTRVNLLSDISISTFRILNNHDFIVGYENGNIDLYLNGVITNIPDLKNKPILGSKRINQFYLYGSKIYASTDFGVLVIDPLKKEISDTYFPGSNGENLVVNGMVSSNNYFYLATEKGILKAPVNSPNLSYYQSWSLASGDISFYADVFEFNSQLFCIRQENSQTYSLRKSANGLWEAVATIDHYSSFSIAESKLLITTTHRLNVYNSALLLVTEKDKIDYGTLDPITPAFNHAVFDEINDCFYIADSNEGVLVSKSGNDDVSRFPQGPLLNSIQHLAFNGDVLMVCPGGKNASGNNMLNSAQLYLYDGTWSNLNGQSDSLFYGEVDVLFALPDPSSQNRALLCSWGDGIFEMENNQITKHYDQHNSILQNIDWAGDMYVRIASMAFDKSRNLYINNSEVDHGIVVRTADDHWATYSYKALIKVNTFGPLMADDYGNIWGIILRNKYSPTGQKTGLFVFNINGTPLDDSDDMYRGPYMKSQDTDFRNDGAINIVDDDGSEVSLVYCMAKDKNGYLWFGTDRGIFVYYRAWAVFQDSDPQFYRVSVPRNDGTNYIDYLLDDTKVTAIAIDGANRKWIGTETSGVFLVSEDGTKTILKFNTDNSPLFSNNITAIAVHPLTGEVFIGTDKGLVSYKGTAIEGKSDFRSIYAYPNPVRKGYNGNIVVTGLMENSSVKVTDISGKLVYETVSLGGQAIWNGKNLWGEKVRSGVYLVFATTSDGVESEVTKILVVDSD